ncbi:MAG: hypothetical protein J3R72DRAFT_450279 [Linnemannia gamsii]|nr:MAG: hypothetical protein J3R72DRAFT_450279 [Linnemannia gamsii]
MLSSSHPPFTQKAQLLLSFLTLFILKPLLSLSTKATTKSTTATSIVIFPCSNTLSLFPPSHSFLFHSSPPLPLP